MTHLIDGRMLSLVFWAACMVVAHAVEPEQGLHKPLVVLVSIDGFKPHYLTRGLTPTLSRLAQSGVVAKGLKPSFPSLTFPNHYSMVTGLYPDHHGIVNNKMLDPEIAGQVFRLSSRESVSNPAWWKEGIPIWVTLQQQGKIAATLFWPGSEAPNQGIQPTYWLPYNEKLSSQNRVDVLLDWLSRPDKERPDLATLYFSEVDSAGHRYGPNSPQVNQAIRNVDQALARFLLQLEKMGLGPYTTLIITSDHGMADVRDDQVIYLDSYLKDYPQTTIQWSGALAGFDFGTESPTAIFASLQQEKHMQCWPKEKLPQAFHFGSHRRIPDGICLAQIGWIISGNRWLPQINRGQHGFDPAHPDMHGILIAAGRKIVPQKLGVIENIEIYPLLCALLTIRCEKSDAHKVLLKIISNPLPEKM
ncbi:MAG: alkaline phosphatase family protein [Ottowia sp.]|nr:alkaline phosphatase family protein [Ottowia sp.]